MSRDPKSRIREDGTVLSGTVVDYHNGSSSPRRGVMDPNHEIRVYSSGHVTEMITVPSQDFGAGLITPVVLAKADEMFASHSWHELMKLINEWGFVRMNCYIDPIATKGREPYMTIIRSSPDRERLHIGYRDAKDAFYWIFMVAYYTRLDVETLTSERDAIVSELDELRRELTLP